MTSEFGPRLRRERERRKISLDSIAATTKVSAALFEGLERDDLSRWPSGIFRRSFVRSYAQAIGMDPDVVVREFLERFPSPDNLADPLIAVAERDPITAAAAAANLRLKFADAAPPFANHLLTAVRGRWAAASVDAAVIVAVGAVLFALFGAFWMPLALFTFLYYWASILLLGRTPGVYVVDQPRRNVRARTAEGDADPKPHPVRWLADAVASALAHGLTDRASTPPRS